jgi:hypothetical protein
MPLLAREALAQGAPEHVTFNRTCGPCGYSEGPPKLYPMGNNLKGESCGKASSWPWPRGSERVGAGDTAISPSKGSPSPKATSNLGLWRTEYGPTIE